MNFEFVPLKSDANLRKHGIDFLEAQALWRDPALVEIPARTLDEPRFLVIARLQGRHWSAVPVLMRCSSMNSSEFDRRFEEGESVLEALDLEAARRPRLEARRVNVDFPLWMVEQLDREASRLGVTRQSIIKLWLAERLESRSTASIG